MARRARLLGAFVLSTLLLLALLPAVDPAVPSPLAPLQGELRALLPAFTSTFSGAVDLGPIAPTTLDVGVALPPTDPAAADALVQGLYTPGSPDYGHFLSPAGYQAEFSPSPASYAAVERYYSDLGLTLHPSPDRLMLGLSGSSGAVQNAFHTSLHRYALADGRTVFGPARAIYVPSALGISAVTGFTDVVRIHPTYAGPPLLAPVRSPAGGAAGGTAAGNGSALPGVTCAGGSTTCMWWGQYGLTSLENSGMDGAGMTVGIVDAYDSGFSQASAASYLSSYASGEGLPAPTLNFLYPVRTGANLNASPSSGWGGETSLDIGVVDSMAPGATIDLAFAADQELAVYQTVDYLVAENVTQTISMSWGEADVGTMHEGPTPCMPYYSCNATWDGSYAFLHPVFQEAAAEGITPFAASGDCGAADSTTTVATDYPSSDPYVVGVGGTVLNSSGTSWGGGRAWSGNGTGCTANTGGGGGGWAPFPQPWYQHGWNIPNKNLRGNPDVAADSSGGTSQSSPLWAGMTAVADQMHGRGLGLLSPALYAIYRSSSYNSTFHDIVVGNNGYATGRGWDPCTGLGDPIASALFPLLWPTTPSPYQGTLTVALTATPNHGSAPLTTTFSATASGGTPPYQYDFVPGPHAGQWTGGASTLTYRYGTSGSYFATVVVFDASGNSSQSVPFLLRVGVGGSPLSVTLVPSATSVTVGTPVTYTTTAGGGTSPYTYNYSWGDGSYGYNASASSPHTYYGPGTYCASVDVLDAAAPGNGGIGNASCVTVTPQGGGGGLTAGFTASPTSGAPPLAVAFTSTVSGGTGPYAYTWGYGDGSLGSTAADPSHTYNTSGTFQVNLTVLDSASHRAHASTNLTVSAFPPLLPVASVAPSSGAAPLAVVFNGTASGGEPGYAFAWDFGDGSAPGSGRNPAHTYTGPGTFTATLTVSDQQGVHASSTATVGVSPAPLTASAAALPLTGAAPLAVTFNGSAAGGQAPYRWSWAFGDGATSAAENPLHVYNTSGTFPVTLTATDTLGTVASATALTITVGPAVVTVSATGPSSVVLGNAAAFAATATGGSGTYAFAWDFGDGTSSTQQNPSHTYLATGPYAVSVRATDSNGVVSAPSNLSVGVTSATPLSVDVSGPAAGAPGALLTFTASATGGAGGYVYSFSLGDGTVTSPGASPSTTHAYTSTGSYDVTVTVTDALGVRATSQVHQVSISTPATPPAGGNPFLSGGGLSLYGWALVAAVGLAVLLVAFLLFRRRSRAVGPPPMVEYGGYAPPAGDPYGAPPDPYGAPPEAGGPPPPR